MSEPALLTFATRTAHAAEDLHSQETASPFLSSTETDHPSPPTFEALFRKFAPMILHALPFLGVAEADTDDLCQEIFLTVHQKLPTFEGRSTLKTWIYGICLRKVSNYRRQARHRYEYSSEKIAEQAVQIEQVQQIHKEQQLDILERALALLSEKKRVVFVLYEIEELSMEEVAQVARCPVFTAYARLYAARREIKRVVRRLVNTRSTKRISS